MSDLNDFVISNVREMQLWANVPTYEKLNITYCIKLGFCSLFGSFEAINGLKNYLAYIRNKNKKYKEFWKDTSNIKFNKDKSQYLCMYLNNIQTDL